MAMPEPPLTQDFGQNLGMPSQQGPFEYQQQQPSTQPQPPPPHPEPQQSQQFQFTDQQQYPNTSPDYSADDSASFAFRSPDSFYSKVSKYVGGRYQLLLDTTTPHWAARWTFSLVILIIFMARVILAQGWYVICYGLSIYYLNLFIGFLSPKIDPAFQAAGEFDADDFGNNDLGPMLPTKANDEFRPFIRRLPEFKFWLSATKATLISLFLTLFEVFDLPVFWPILLLYFLLLFVSTMRQQIRHMIKYGYVPWDKGKKKYGNQNQEPSSLFSPTI